MFKKIFKAVAACVTLCTALLLTGCGGNDQNAVREEFIHIATGNTTGTYYPVGGVISEILNTNIDKMHSGVQTTSGSVSNLRLLVDDTVELAIVQNDIASFAASGTEMFKDENKYKFDTVKALAALYPESCQVVTTEASGIKSIAELRGKKVAVGAEGSGAEANARQILEAYGITYNDIDAQYLSFSAGAKALKDGNVDVVFLTAGFPTLAIQDITAQTNINLLPIDDEHIKALTEKYPFYTKIVIPKGIYNKFDKDVQTVSVTALLVCNEKVNDDLGYKITKSIFDNLDTFKNAHPVLKNFDKKVAAGVTGIEMNGGAKKFFDEK